MALVNNEPLFREIEVGLGRIQKEKESDIILSPFTKDFSLRFCWSSNAMEGNTLSLEEIISLIEYDEVRAGHTYTEYHEAKNLYQAIQELLIPFHKETVTEKWIKKGNGRIGRMLMNQELINQNLLPIAMNPAGKYRQAFQRYEKNGDLSLMIHQICRAEIEAIQRMECLIQRRDYHEND